MDIIIKPLTEELAEDYFDFLTIVHLLTILLGVGAIAPLGK